MSLTKLTKVAIVIQARSNSTRFPQKIYQLIGKKMVITHVVDAAKSAKQYLERLVHRANIRCDVAIVYPKGDLQVVSSCRTVCPNLIESPNSNESDVLSRYQKAMEELNADYIVRLTSDCPLILDFVISKHINVAVLNDLDFVSNTFEPIRFSFDGLDVEVLSKKAMKWLADNVTEAKDFEHVTSLIKSTMPKELTYGFITHKLDSSGMKLSLDTQDDLDKIRAYYHDREYKLSLCSKMFNKRSIYEI